MAYLLAKNGPDAGSEFILDGEQAVLGRHPDCNIVVDVSAVSRQHCQISSQNGYFIIRDLDSRNGTFVNGTEVNRDEPYQLAPGDTVRVCDVTFTFHDENYQPPPDSSRWRPTTSDDSHRTVMIEDSDSSNPSTIMSKINVSGDSHRAQLTATPQVKLKALVDIAYALSKTLALDEVLPKVLDSLFQIFLQADRGFIVMPNESGELVPMWTKVRREDRHETLRISRTIINQVLESKQAILSADAANDSRFDLSQSVAEFRIRSLMCAPLLDGEGRTIGVLQVDTLDQNKRFQSEDLEVLAMVALQAGIAIDNAQMHENALQQRELERDLELAQQMQNGFLPDAPPAIDGYRFHDYYHPAHHVGGDYFDYLELPDGRLAIVVADVVGHGVTAALLMVKFSAEFRFSLASEATVSGAMTRLNRAIAKLQLDRFITMVLVVLEPSTGKLTIAVAGHTPPLIRRANGEVETIGEEAADIPLGIEEDVQFGQSEATIHPGELIVLWTDGIHETMNLDNDQFGIERISALMKGSAQPDPAIVGKQIIDAARDFQADPSANDDMCLVSFCR